MAERPPIDEDEAIRQLGNIKVLCEQAKEIKWDQVWESIQLFKRRGGECCGGQCQEAKDCLERNLHELTERYHELLSAQKTNDNPKLQGNQSGNQREKLQKYKQYIEQLERENKELEENCSYFKSEYNKAMQEHEEFRQKINKNYQKEVNDFQSQKKSLSEELKKMEVELTETKNRLSAQMSAQVSDNNPDIVDLSDANRPNKLAERYQELYDNQWSDAYEALEKFCSQSYPGMSETDHVKYLLDILQDARKFCEAIAEKQTLQLKRVLFTGQCGEALPDIVRKQLKDITKAMIPRNVDLVYKSFMEKFQSNSAYSRSNIRDVQSYMKECIMVCWIMALSDPPIEFGPEAMRYDEFNSNLYKTYTEKGEWLDYVVWPPLFVSGSDAVLSKGTAQAIPRIGSSASSVPSTRVQSDKYTRAQSAPVTRDQGNKGPLKIHGLDSSDSQEHRDEVTNSAGDGSDFARSVRSRPSYHQETVPARHTDSGRQRSDNRYQDNSPSNTSTRHTRHVYYNNQFS